MQQRFALVLVLSASAVLLLLYGVPDAQAALARGLRGSRAHPGKCLIAPNVTLLPGQRARDPYACGIVHCLNDMGYTNFTTCFPVLPPPQCRFVEPLEPHAPYPYCCKKRLVCHR